MRHGGKEADGNIAPFLRLLCDHGLINCKTNPNDSTLDTRIKAQKLVYMAQCRFGLEFRYSHSLHLHGPYSIGLANDYFRIRDICDMPSGGLEGWAKKEDFLKFAKGHNDVRWLEIATTLIFTLEAYMKGSRGRLLERVQEIKRDFSKEYVEQVYADLVSSGLIAE
ncbi:MAG: hypothetical protein OXU86_00355 [Thaumarchaeota archaeon]|nr:hypothetical protein [Nitrososphaerota archaeon]